ncbi:non-ribosomal peptide synthetase [Actinophytocola sp. NPDC049390]|uniref:non-ribosomal peptide synthetase n=1 Tax=Actinophytocola sp. NPDC049390 TaxID=3363894 RepID=UPI003793B6EB
MTITARPGLAARTGAGEVLDAVDRWAARLPAATAVTAPDGVLTFAELQETIRNMASALRAAGAGPGVPVGLGFGRSKLTVPALLAVWHTGATAVPLDDRHPADRLAFILRDAGVQLLLGELPFATTASTVDLTATAAHLPAHAPAPGDLAYIVYTSGTTGRPKGVEIGYRALGTFLDAIATLGLTPGGVGFNPLSPAFDGWFWCTLLYLLHGQGVAIVDTDGTDLASALASVAPRTVCMSPSLYAACPDDMPSVDVFVVAGEAATPGLLRRLRGRRVLNVYGPTETTIAATWADSADGDDVRTIGRAMPGYRTYVLDADGAPVPPGGDGELCVGGPALAHGYRNLPDLTGDRFVPDPSGDGRMYRTGDRVRLRPDGQMEFLGRVDDQVKIRGFRVELGEVERTAADADEVRAATAFVLATGDALGLAVVPEPGVDPVAAVEAATGRCRHLLPDFMVPSVVDAVTELPVTAHGKADRAALAEQADARQAVSGGRPPATERERQVCDVWSSVLPRPVYDVDANFFTSGGHSLLASRAVVALRKATGLRLSIKDLLTHPTPAELARKLDRLAES